VHSAPATIKNYTLGKSSLQEIPPNYKMQVSKTTRLYRLISISMMGIGIGLLLLSMSPVLNQRAACQDYVREDVLSVETHIPCNDPSFYIENPANNNFILTVLSICLASFGAALLGIVLRLGK
jgi:hypothetical protein